MKFTALHTRLLAMSNELNKSLLEDYRRYCIMEYQSGGPDMVKLVAAACERMTNSNEPLSMFISKLASAKLSEIHLQFRVETGMAYEDPHKKGKDGDT